MPQPQAQEDKVAHDDLGPVLGTVGQTSLRGALTAHGAYDPVGTPYHYAVAQCPALLAALWDTTDRELDGVCEAVLRLVGLLPGAARSQWLSLPRAVAAARTECKLPYLTGAACVVYGAPVCWR